MKMLKTALCAAAATLAMTGAANAAEFAFNAGIASDYVFRGIDQTAGAEGELFGGVDVTQDQFYGGVWLSNTGPDGDGALEYDLYAGWKPSYAGASFDLGVIYYGYTDNDSGTVSSDFDALEIKAAVSYPVGPVVLGAAAYYAPENGAFGDESTLYLEANVAYTFEGDHGPTLSAAVGNFSIDNFAPVDDYTTWNAGVTLPINDTLSVDARYIDVNDDAVALFGPVIADQKVVVTAKVVF